MRDYGKVHTGFWTSDNLRGLDVDAKLLAIYLMTSPHTNMIGCFRLPDAYACDDLGWTPERLRNGFETLSKGLFVKYDEKTKWVWIIKFLSFNKPENPNQWKAAAKLADSIPASVSFKNEVSETVSKPLNNTPVPAPVPALLLEEEKVSDADAVLETYHEILPRCQRIAVLGAKRKRTIATACKYAKQVCREQGWPYVAREFWRAYFTECAKDPWLRGDKPNPNNPDWKQKIDTLLDEQRFSAVMDRAIAAMRGAE